MMMAAGRRDGWTSWLLLSLLQPGDGVYVKTTLGTVRGVYDDGLAVFAGIPYAQPPVGRLRFLPPKPLASGGGAIDATAFQPDCLQSSVGNALAPTSQAEDCLYLNIWVPTPRAPGVGASLARVVNFAALRPVLVWIHGGAFRSGGTSMPCYNGSALARRADALVVSVNYRLGPFGFLVSARDGVAGNAGVADQKLALRWLADNVRAFGGDPAAVTLFGESAGAMSVGLHLTDPEACPLFRAAALMSAPLSYRYRTIALADVLSRAFLESLQCSGVGALACAQAEPAAAILAAAELISVPRHVSDLLWWAPHAPAHWGGARRGGGGREGDEGAAGGEGGRGRDVRLLGPRHSLSLLEAIGGSHAAGAVRPLTAEPTRAAAGAAPRPAPLPPPSTRAERLRRTALRVARVSGATLALATAAARPRTTAPIAATCGPGAVASVADLPLLIGSTADEGAFFLALAGVGGKRMGRTLFWATVALMFRFAAHGVLQVYGTLAAAAAAPREGAAGAAAAAAGASSEPADYLPVFAAILTDYMFRCPARRLAAALHSVPRASRTYAYRFSQASNHTPVQACRGLACHTMELPFLFEQPEPPLRFSREEAALAHAMGDAWASFARTGAPGALGRGASAAGGVLWPAWSVDGEETMDLRWPPQLVGGALAPACDPACDCWDATGYVF
jgi:carboxylesterase type B